MANVLPMSARVAVIAHLVDGCSIRTTVRLTGVSKGAILRLLVLIGTGCAILHDRMVRAVPSAIIEADELFAYVFKKEKRKRDADPETWGDAYTWTAMCVTSRLILSYLTAKRDPEAANEFMADLRARVTGRPQLSTDGFGSYPEAVRRAFGYQGVDYGVCVKEYENSIDRQMAAAHRYSPGRVKSMTRTVVFGNPDVDLINTSHMERGNLTFRMQQRRFTRLTNGFSKKVDNLRAAVALHVMHYNFVREHMTLRTTPAVAAGLSDRAWSLAELVAAALDAAREAGETDPTDGGATPAPSPETPAPLPTVATWRAPVQLPLPGVGSAANDNATPDDAEEEAPATVRDPAPWGCAVAL